MCVCVCVCVCVCMCVSCSANMCNVLTLELSGHVHVSLWGATSAWWWTLSTVVCVVRQLMYRKLMCALIRIHSLLAIVLLPSLKVAVKIIFGNLTSNRVCVYI